MKKTIPSCIAIALAIALSAHAEEESPGAGEYASALQLLEQKDSAGSTVRIKAALEAAADAGSVTAHRKLAELHYFGDHGFQKDLPLAAIHAKIAALAGDAWSQNLLANMLENGQGIEADRSAALYWYEQAARQGETIAQSGLGMLLRKGNPSRQETITAYVWLRVAAKNKDLSAIRQLEGFQHTITDSEKSGAQLRINEIEALIARKP